MRKRKKGSAINKLSMFLSVFLVGCALFSISLRALETSSGQNLALLAASFVVPQGNMNGQTMSEISSARNKSNDTLAKTVEKPEPVLKDEKNSQTDKDSNNEEVAAAANEEKTTLPVIESQYGSSGSGYDNFFVRNTTDYIMNFNQLLSSPLGFEMEETAQPQVLIIHTHTTEAYLKEDVGYYYEGQEFRNTNDNENILQVGNAIVNRLKKNGIGAVHATEYHDAEAYNGSYDRSEQTIYKYMEQYPSIKVVLDIHRDSIGYDDERGKMKPTFVANGKKAAQIMIMSGYDPYDSYGFAGWEDNLKFALKIQQSAESMYPGMTRPLYFGDFAYNMFINSGSLLIEVGTEVNTLDEAVYSGELLAEVLTSVLNSA